jgi:hypothetical protein
VSGRDGSVPVPGRIAAGIERARNHIAASGTCWTGIQRVELAETARLASTGDAPLAATTVPDLARRTATKIATQAHRLDAADVDALDSPAAYVEIVGIVARTTAIDTTARGVGAAAVPFPPAAGNEPDGRVNAAVKRRSALVPTAGPAGPTTALSAVPSEDAAQADLHGALYLSYHEMGDLSIHKGLPRWQLELVAARTSLINRCHY